MTDEFLLVVTTCDDAETARALARAIVGERLAACVNIVPGVESVYRWDDKVQLDREFVLLIKTVRPRFDEVAAAIRRVSGYELPEILAVPVAGGSDDYLNWISSAVEAGD